MNEYVVGIVVAVVVAVVAYACRGAIVAWVKSEVAAIKAHISDEVGKITGSTPVVVNVNPVPAPILTAPPISVATAPTVAVSAPIVAPVATVSAPTGHEFLGTSAVVSTPTAVPAAVMERDPEKTTSEEFGEGLWLRVNGSAVRNGVPLKAGHYTVEIEPQASSVQGSIAHDGVVSQLGIAFTVANDTIGTLTAQGAGNIQLLKLTVQTPPANVHPLK